MSCREKELWLHSAVIPSVFTFSFDACHRLRIPYFKIYQPQLPYREFWFSILMVTIRAGVLISAPTAHARVLAIFRFQSLACQRTHGEELRTREDKLQKSDAGVISLN